MKKHTLLDTLKIVAESETPIDNHGIIKKSCLLHPHLRKRAITLQRNINNHLKTLCEAGILFRHATDSNKLKYTSLLKTDELLKRSTQKNQSSLTPFFLSLSEKLLESNLPEHTFELMKSAFFNGALINFDERAQKRKKSFDELIFLHELRNCELRKTDQGGMAKTIAILESAYQNGKAIEFEYESANEGVIQKKRIGIEGLVVYIGQPYLLGNEYDHLTPYFDSRRIKPYKLIRIRNAMLIDESNYERTWIDSLQKYYEGSLGLWRNEGNIMHGIELRVATRILPFFTEILPCEVSILDKGQSISTVQLGGIRVNRDFYRFLLQWGADVKVTQPQIIASNLEKYRKTSIVNEEKQNRLRSDKFRMDSQTEILIQLASELRTTSGQIVENILKTIGIDETLKLTQKESLNQNGIGLLRWNYIPHQRIVSDRGKDQKKGEFHKRIRRLTDLELHLTNSSKTLENKLLAEAAIANGKPKMADLMNIRFDALMGMLNLLKTNSKTADYANLHLNKLNSFLSRAFEKLKVGKKDPYFIDFVRIAMSDLDCTARSRHQAYFIHSLKNTILGKHMNEEKKGRPRKGVALLRPES